jgi:hypothetical protein
MSFGKKGKSLIYWAIDFGLMAQNLPFSLAQKLRIQSVAIPSLNDSFLALTQVGLDILWRIEKMLQVSIQLVMKRYAQLASH